MRASAIRGVIAAAAALSGDMAFADLVQDAGGPTANAAITELNLAFALGVLGVLVVLGGSILTARVHRQRCHTRHPCSLTVRLEPTAGAPVRLVDLSRRGARLRMILPPLPGSTLRLHWEDVTLEATVVWSGEVFAGLNFHGTLPKRTMARMLAASPRRSAGAAAADWVQPGLGA